MTSQPDSGRELMNLLVEELIRRLRDDPKAMVASELEVCRKLLADNSVTLAQVRRGDFGAFAQKTAEDFPFDDDGNPIRSMQ